MSMVQELGPSDTAKKPRDGSSSAGTLQRSPSSAQLNQTTRITSLLGFLTLMALIALGLGIGAEHLMYGDPTLVESTRVYSKAAVATDAGPCSKIGVTILRKGGGAVDAAISSALCVGLVNLHSTGIGGGGFMVVYEASSKEVSTIDFREVAPRAATKDMYEGMDPTASTIGGLSVAVPAELRGLEMAWKKWGRLKWEELFEPVINLAREGFPVSAAISKAIQARKNYILSGKFPGIQELLAPNGKLLEENDILRRPVYADTLEMIARYGADWFYSGHFLEDMVQELREQGSILTEEDFMDYTPVERRVTESWYKGLSLRSMWAPSGGPVMSLILNILDKYNFRADDFGDLAYHRTVEAFKFAYAQRLKLGDPAFNDTIDDTTKFMLDLNTAKEMFSRITDDMTHNQDYYMWPSKYTGGDTAHDHGTSHLSVLAENGDAVACTSTINLYFGSLIRSKRSGVIFNDEMDDFSYPTRNDPNSYEQTEINYIEPGKRPLSSMTPTILLDGEGKVKMVVGASGGFKITTAVAQVILNTLGFQKQLNESIDLPRLHHQLFPNYIKAEDNFPEAMLASLRTRGHKIITTEDGAVVQGIFKTDTGDIFATSDKRKGGVPDGY